MNDKKNRSLAVAAGLVTLSASLCAVAQVPPAPPAPAAAAPEAVQRAPTAPPAATPASLDDAAYLIGVNLGQQLHGFGVTGEIPIERIIAGLQEGLAGKRVSPDDHRRLQAFLRSEIDSVAAKNAQAAKEFLELNGKKKGVKMTASGLQYKITAVGNSKAASPQPTDEVTVQYRGQLLDGTEFDSSYKHGAPSTFAMAGVIKGWQEALTLMKPGAKWQLFIPPALAYGLDSRPGIPAGSLLIFEVELRSVKAPSPAADASMPAASSRPSAGAT
jgi:FKBP-type peptidyl-prolyl cis-trans isomerase